MNVYCTLISIKNPHRKPYSYDETPTKRWGRGWLLFRPPWMDAVVTRDSRVTGAPRAPCGRRIASIYAVLGLGSACSLAPPREIPIRRRALAARRRRAVHTCACRVTCRPTAGVPRPRHGPALAMHAGRLRRVASRATRCHLPRRDPGSIWWRGREHSRRGARSFCLCGGKPAAAAVAVLVRAQLLGCPGA